MEDDFYSKALSKNLRTIRTNKGLSTTDLAKILGVSQAKISYIENCKGILSARDVALLARRLDVPVTEFFHGLDKAEAASEQSDLAGHLARFGASLLSKPAGIALKVTPFEEVFCRALGFLEDDRLHQGFCAALIAQSLQKEINGDQIFALIGNNPFLVASAAKEASLCLQIIEHLNKDKEQVSPRATRQIRKILTVAEKLDLLKFPHSPVTQSELAELADFVARCLNAKK